VLDAGEHLEQGGLRECRRHIGEENSTRRETAGAPWRAAVGLAEVDNVERLARNNDHDQAEEDEGDEGMCIVPVDVRLGPLWGCLSDIAHGEHVELFLAFASGCVDWKQNRPCDETTQERDDDENLEEAHKQIAINGLVVEDVSVGEPLEILDPSKQSPTGRRRLALLAQVVEIRARGIHATEMLARNEEGRHEC
jgi:hypothetical protein